MKTFAWGAALPEIFGTRILLRPIRDDDAPAIFAIFGDPEVVRYWSSGPQRELSDARRLIREIAELFARRILFQWGIARATDDALLGTCTLHQWDPGHRRAEIGFALARQHWGQGYAAEALRTLLRFSFGELDLHRLEADTDPRNTAALRLLERLAFRREGLLRERFWVNGEIQDSVFLGLLRRDWEAAVTVVAPTQRP